MPNESNPLAIEETINFGSKEDLHNQAEQIANEERMRYIGGRETLRDAYRQSQQALSSLVDPDLLYSKAADSVGARGRTNLESLRRSLSSRGISPNSGAAQGALSRLAFQTQGDLIGAKRDIALDNQRQRQVNAATQFAQALQLADYTNSPVSGIRYEAAQDAFEGDIAIAGINAQSASQKRSSRSNLLGSIIGGGASILAGLI